MSSARTRRFEFNGVCDRSKLIAMDRGEPVIAKAMMLQAIAQQMAATFAAPSDSYVDVDTRGCGFSMTHLWVVALPTNEVILAETKRIARAAADEWKQTFYVVWDAQSGDVFVKRRDGTGHGTKLRRFRMEVADAT
jgi:hypothetical protein